MAHLRGLENQIIRQVMRRCAGDAAKEANKWKKAASDRAKSAEIDLKRKEWMAIFDKSGGSISAQEALALYYGIPGTESGGYPAENGEGMNPECSGGDDAIEEPDDPTQGERGAESHIAEKGGGH